MWEKLVWHWDNAWDNSWVLGADPRHVKLFWSIIVSGIVVAAILVF